MSKVIIKSPQEIEWMKESCRIVADVLRLLKGIIRAGISTREIDTIAEDFIRSQGGEPAFKGYGADKRNLFPASVCASINDEVVHGIPGERRLLEGDIISIDVGVKKNGFYGDGAWTFCVGKVSEQTERLMKVSEESLYEGIRQARAGNRVNDISQAVHR